MERTYLRQRPKSENWASLTPRSSATVGLRRTEKSTRPGKLPGPRTTKSAVHPVTCSLLWVRCLFDRLRQIFDFQIFRFRHPDYDPDRAQKSISSSMSRHLSIYKISSKSMHAFLSNLANRQIDRQTDIAGNRIYLLLCRRYIRILLLFIRHSSRRLIIILKPSLDRLPIGLPEA